MAVLSWARRYVRKARANAPSKRRVTQVGQKPKHGPSAWKPLVGQRSRHQPSLSASMADTAGWKLNAIAVRPAPASRLMPSVGRAIRRFGSWKDRFAAE